MQEYPNILVISGNAFSQNTNNGKTLECLLNSWHSKKIAHIYFRDEEEDTDFCGKYFSLTYYDAADRMLSINKRKNYPLTESVDQNEDLIRRKWKIYGYPIKKIYKEMKGSVEVDNTFQKFRQNVKQRRPSGIMLEMPLAVEKKWIRRRLIEWLGAFQPELIIFQCSGSQFMFETAFYLKKIYKIPMLIQVLDDFTMPLNNNSKLERWIASRYTKTLKRAIDESASIIAISDAMVKEYKSKYGGLNYHVFSNANDFFCNNKSSDDVQGLLFLYTGNLGLERINVLAQLGRAIDIVARDRKIRILLRIYSGTKISSEQNKLINDISCIDFRGFIEPERIKDEMEKADYLLHVESFSEQYRKMVRLSISTKIGEYLSSNRCIVAIGPNEVASISYLKDKRLGYVITEEVKPKHIAELLEMNKEKDIFIRNARKEYEARYTQDKIDEMMRGIVYDI